MSDDVPNSDVVDQLHYDLFVKRLTGGDNTGFSNDLEKGASGDGVSKTVSRRFFYSLVSWLSQLLKYLERVPSRNESWFRFPA
jgi:hypothetical protein